MTATRISPRKAIAWQQIHSTTKSAPPFPPTSQAAGARSFCNSHDSPPPKLKSTSPPTHSNRLLPTPSRFLHLALSIPRPGSKRLVHYNMGTGECVGMGVENLESSGTKRFRNMNNGGDGRKKPPGVVIWGFIYGSGLETSWRIF